MAAKAVDALRQWYDKSDAQNKLATLFDDTKTEMEKGRGDEDGNDSVQGAQRVIDLAFRKLVDELSRKMLTQHLSPKEAGIATLLDVAIAGAQKNLLWHVTPYNLLADAIEAQTIKNCVQLWELLEERKQALTSAPLIPVGKSSLTSLSLLRLCNGLLRRLSKAHNTVFCGKILVFLSHTFALKERSGVNLKGRSNEQNITLFDDESTFDQVIPTPHSDSLDMEVDGNPVEPGPIDYKLYKTFWSLQRFFRLYDYSIESAAHWEQFLIELDNVLRTFEGNAFSADDLIRAKHRRDALPERRTGDEQHYFQPKYLTNSRLLRLQLRDPILRECMLTQFLILFNHLMKTKLPQDIVTPKEKLNEFQDRIELLLAKTPPNGAQFARIVDHVLDRERNWIQWKVDKCPPFERFADEELTTWVERQTNEPRKKRKIQNIRSNAILKKIIHDPPAEDPLEGLDAADRDVKLTYESLLERFTDAWDPENGIEKAYWPENDILHCWRTMRETWKNKLTFMKFAKDGTNEIVRQIKNIPKPDVQVESSADDDSMSCG